MIQDRIVGVGIDLVEIAEIKRLLSDPGGHFLRRCFTDAERATAGAGARGERRLAGRFAVKEAVVKAIGTGWGDGIAWNDIEVLAASSGAPLVTLRDGAAAAAGHVRQWFVSVSYAGAYVTAVALAVGERPECSDRTCGEI
ncbi:holo-ACP synthase [Muricoccus radiodurans]|uniref:holo-ACP synthase n=1 Tax=Muricoccus radiodurans TaxID=2231721 RepID=UPI003CF2A3EC